MSTSKFNFVCKNCDRIYKGSKSFIKHIEFCDLQKSCEKCGKTNFSSPSMLKNHIQKCTWGIKECACGKLFLNNGTKKSHQRKCKFINR